MESKHVAVKVLRLSPGNMEELLRVNPRIKIVHLFRDPRSVIHSHLTTEFYQLTQDISKDMINDIDALCSRLNEDIVALKKMIKKYPGRLKVVRYEDFVDKNAFLERAQELYDFLGFSFTAENIRHLINNFYLDANNHRIKFQPKEGFRDMSNFELVRYIDDNCDATYEAVGYLKFKSELDFKNTTFRAISDNGLKEMAIF